MFWFGLEHVEVETEVNQGGFMMIGGMRAHGEREPVPIHNHENLRALAAFRDPHDLTAAPRVRGSGVPNELTVQDMNA